MNGLVVTHAFNAKFTTRIAKKLNLTGAYKYNDRDNRTPVNIYQYADAGEAAAANANFPAGPNNPLGAVLAQNANANRPYGTKLNQLNFDADYALGGGQWIKGGYDFQKIDRACHGSWITARTSPRPTRTRCVPTGGRASGRTIHRQGRLRVFVSPGADLQRERVPRAGAVRERQSRCRQPAARPRSPS